MFNNMRICIFGSSGLAGQGIAKALQDDSQCSSDLLLPRRIDVDLENYQDVVNYLLTTKPDIVIMAAGKVGGIDFNQRNQILQYEYNQKLNENLLLAASKVSIKRFILISSSCIYPVSSVKPIKEADLFNGLPEATNEGYAAAKSNAIRHLLLRRKYEDRNWSALIPTNIYGNVSHFLTDDHVLPMLIRKFQSGVNVINVWGDGTPIRQFLNNYDLGLAVRFSILNDGLPPILNVSTDESVTIKELINKLVQNFKFKGEIIFDVSKPNGNPDKSLDNSLMKGVGWKSTISLESGLTSLVSYLNSK
jgi:GDP-L-fucose synthase